MNHYQKGLYVAVFAGVLAGSVAPAFAAGPGFVTLPEAAQAEPAISREAQVLSQPLNGVVITGNSNPLLRFDQRLALLNASLPLDGDSSTAQPSDLERVAALFPQSPDAAVGEARRMMERGQTPPDGSDPDGNIALGAR